MGIHRDLPSANDAIIKGKQAHVEGHDLGPSNKNILPAALFLERDLKDGEPALQMPTQLLISLHHEQGFTISATNG